MRKYADGLGRTDWEDFAHTAGYQSEREMLEEMYSGRGLSMSEIGQRMNRSKWVVLYQLRKHGIRRRTLGGYHHLPDQLWRLAHCDQRIVLHHSLHEVAKAAKVSPPVLWRYRRWIEINSKWGEVYESPEKAAQRRFDNQRAYVIFRARYGWWKGISKTVGKR